MRRHEVVCRWALQERVRKRKAQGPPTKQRVRASLRRSNAYGDRECVRALSRAAPRGTQHSARSRSRRLGSKGHVHA
ncbi:hypothetical protein [Scytonema sp. PRP1]|uniref:hypothetical protein n=1 Tax=Scytonema sp. PRP1 TaxID=3120513 RepID=UPI002FCE979D